MESCRLDHENEVRLRELDINVQKLNAETEKAYRAGRTMPFQSNVPRLAVLVAMRLPDQRY